MRGPTIAQAGFHHTNMLAQQLNSSIENKISSRDSEIVALLQNIPGLSSASTDSTSYSTSSEEDFPQRNQVNATSTNLVQMEILKLLKDLSEDTKQTKAALPKRRVHKKTPDDRNSPPCDDLSKCCWTHGAFTNLVKNVAIGLQGIKQKQCSVTRWVVLRLIAADGWSRAIG